MTEKEMLLTLDMLVGLVDEYIEEIEIKDLKIALLRKRIKEIEKKKEKEK